MLDGSMAPASEPTLKIMPSVYESQPAREKRDILEQNATFFIMQRQMKNYTLFKTIYVT